MTKRIQFEFSDETVQRLDTLKDQTDPASYAAVVRKALRLYEWALECDREGARVGAFKDGQLTVVEFL